MIELNLTYEESKKILEFGYDFSKVCIEFRFYEEGAKYTSVRRFEDGDVELYSSQSYDTEIYSIQHLGITPIIPKAALEACLPTSGDGVGDKESFYWYKQLQSGDCHERVSYVFNFDHFGDYSIFEAFVWCHEHYPEELRKKFGEVMG